MSSRITGLAVFRISLLAFAASAGMLCMPAAANDAVVTEKLVLETDEQYLQRMQWWREARLGLFIHWGPVSLIGTEIGWSRGGPRYRQITPERPAIGSQGLE